MAILTGFPPSNTISPSVRIVEKDLSFVPAEQVFNRAAIVGFATKGPINIPTLISTTRQLYQVFGFPDPTISVPYLIYAAEQYLQAGNSLYIIRVADIDPTSSEAATTATVEIPTAGGVVEIEGNGIEPFSYSDINNDAIDDNRFFRWRLNGVLAEKQLVVLADSNRPAPNTNLAYTAQTLADELNSQLTADDGIEFYVHDTDKLGIRSTFSFGTSSTVELVSVTNALYGPIISVDNLTGVRSLNNNEVGLGLDMLPAQIVGSADRFPNNAYQTVGNFDFTSNSFTLEVVIDGTNNVNIDNVAQSIIIPSGNYTSLSLVQFINSYIETNLPGGFVAYLTGDNISLSTLHSGRDAKLLVKSSSTVAAPLGLSFLTNAGSGTTGAADDLTTYNNAVVTGSVGDGSTLFVVNADSPGTSGNNTQLIITNNNREGNFSMQIFVNGTQVESWGALNRVESDPLYVESFLARYSSYVRVIDDVDLPGLPAAGTYVLSGGSNGVPSDPDDQDSLIIGDGAVLTGMQSISEPDQFDIDLIAAPGFTSTEVVLALIDLCENKRQDCIAIIDPPFGFSVNEIVAWQNGTHSLNATKFDSNFAALYWPWVSIRDTTNRIDVWVPPSGSVLATIARSDSIGAQWLAPAGATRGAVPNILDTYTKPSLTERDLMYGNRNAINPIISFAGSDIFVIWGNKTLQRRPTALDRVNVRRLLNFIKKSVGQEARTLLFEPNDATLRTQFIAIADRILSQIQVLRGLEDYRIQCDEELNPPEVVDRNELRARIGIIPTKATEFIFVEVSLHRSGSFTENADTF
jgi:hypothetical protein